MATSSTGMFRPRDAMRTSVNDYDNGEEDIPLCLGHGRAPPDHASRWTGCRELVDDREGQ